MSVTLIQPDGLPDVPLYRQVSVGRGTQQIHVAGQVSVDADGSVIGAGDLAAQAERAYRNLAAALGAAGATFADVVKVTVYVVDLTPDKLPLFQQGLDRAAAELGSAPQAPLTGIGVTALADPDYLIEVDAVAVLD